MGETRPKRAKKTDINSCGDWALLRLGGYGEALKKCEEKKQQEGEEARGGGKRAEIKSKGKSTIPGGRKMSPIRGRTERGGRRDRCG